MKTLQASYGLFVCLLLLSACGPSTDIPGADGTASLGTSGTTNGGVGSGSGIVGLGGTNSGNTGNANNGNANNGNTVATPQTGTVSLSGSIGGSAFTAQDAVFGLSRTAGGLVVMTVVMADQPNLCQLLGSSSGTANLVVAYLSSTNPNTYPGAATYPVTDPNGTLPDAVTTDGAFSKVAFAAVGASQGTFANAGQIQISTSATNIMLGEPMTIQATDAAKDSVQGTLTPAYCSLLSDGSVSGGTSMVATKPRRW